MVNYHWSFQTIHGCVYYKAIRNFSEKMEFILFLSGNSARKPKYVVIYSLQKSVYNCIETAKRLKKTPLARLE